MVLSVITTILGGLGIIGIFIGQPIYIVVGGIAGIIENLIGITSGAQKSLSSAIIAGFIGGAVGLGSGAGVLLGILGGLCFESFLMGVIGYIGVAAFASKKSR